MMIDSELFSLLQLNEDHDILVKLYEMDPVQREDGTYYLQCYLLPISDESNVLLENESIFWDKSKLDGHYCYNVPGDILYNAITNLPIRSLTTLEEVEEQKGKLINLLKNDIIRIKPFFRYDQRGFFYRNPNRNYKMEIIPLLYDTESFFKVPILNEKNYQLLKEHKIISLLDWSITAFGVPNYLLYENHLICLKLTTSKVSEYNFLWKEEDDYLELEFDFDKWKKNHLLILGREGTYAFLEKTTLPLMKKIEVEKKVVDNVEKEEEQEVKENKTKDALLQFENYLKSKNLYYYEEDVQNFHACLKSRILTILAGMSGTGKTRLPLEYAHFFNMKEEDHTLLFLPISPSYNEPSDLLGFYHPNIDRYVPSETGLTSFLKHAYDNPSQMHMVIFDEMNLSQIEYYFAPFLSILEKDFDERYLSLYDSSLPCNNRDQYPSKIKILDNILFVGTINLDETTKDLSDRLLDRSFILSLKKATLDRYNGVMSTYHEKEVKTYQGNYRDLIGKADTKFHFNDVLTAEMREFFDTFDQILSHEDSQKGISFRMVKNIALYLNNSKFDEDDITSSLNFDYAVRQTIMKKIKGSSETLNELIGTLNENKEIESSPILDLFNEYSDISSFELCKQELKNKAFELKKYGYCR